MLLPLVPAPRSTAELFSPPYLGIGPRPVVLTAPGTFYRGKDLAMRISTLEPITKALLLRTGVATHSMNFDARSLWLQIVKQGGGWIALRVPDSPNVLPPGMYMVVLQTARGAVSSGNKIMSLF